MEDLKKEWELGELKRENLRKSLEQVNSQSSSVLFFTLQWKELEDHFDSIRKSIEKRLDFVEFREREVETRMGLLREREEEIGLKKSELSVLNCSSEFDSKSGELDSVMKSVDDCSKELCLKKEQLRSVQNSISECCNKLEGKEFELACLQNSINECSNQLDLKRNELVRSEEVIVEQCKQLSENEKKLDSIKSLIQDYEEELETKKENYEALEKAVGVHAAKLDYFEQKLGLIDEKISARLQELDSLLALIVRRKEDLEAKEEKLHSKEKQLSSVQIWIEGCTKQLEGKEEELHSKEKQLGSVLISIEGCTKQLEGKEEELHSKEKQLGSVLISIEGCTKQLEAKEEELHSKEKQLSSVQMSVKGCTKLLEAKEDELTSIKNSILEFTKELESKKQRFEAIQKSVEKLFGVVKSEEKPLDLVEKVGDECLQVAGVKDDHIGSIKRSLEERLDGLETEKRQFEARVKEFELKEKHFDSVKKSVEQQRKELELKEKKLINALHSQASSENPRSFDTHALGITNTESGIDILLTLVADMGNVRSWWLVANPVTNQIKTETPENFIICNASEASTADLVVGATMDGMALQSILNEHLEDPCLRKNEVLSALQMSPDPAKFVLDLMLGISSQHTKKDGTGFEESFLKISLLMLEQLFQVSPHVQPKVKSDALTLAKEWKTKLNPSAENSTEILCFLQFVAAFGLAHSLSRDEIFKLLATIAQHQQARNVCQVLGFTDMIPDFVGSLVARKQYIEAVRFVCAIDCKDKCPPKQLLELFFDDMNRAACDRCKIGKNSPEVQQKATDEWITSLKSVIECVKDCRLESFMPVEVIEKSISKLEKQKLSLTFSAVQPNVHGRTICNTGPSVPGNHSSPVPAVQQQFHGGNYAFTIGTQWQEQFSYVSNPVTRPPQQFQGMLHASVPLARLHGPSNKRARTDGLVTNSYTPQVPTLNPKIHPASLHGLGVQPNPGINHFRSAANLEHSSTSATRQYLIHNRPKPP
ncbi:hypothetical protein F3Y22_tig00110213pilonHSYRG00253 [Hibiscus syriacus]|uniref:FRIGIDA-like protein n=1 Tax=Hibiscus syriacus TaxID=106335 RepID=A0A6A3B8G6_HIBSY|nr:hypothetical protein F3Y22_tig00110213pilonHSYRG00253 [Hibiscus syriacus]